MLVKTYNFKNATVFVHGELKQETIREATIRLVKNSIKHKQSKGRVAR